MTDKQNESIKKKIRALLSKTVDRGVTESEALSAAAKAAELMEKHDIEMADLEEPVEGIGAAALDIDPALSDALWKFGNAIAELCSCRFLVYPTLRTKVEFVGYDTDREIAVYLMEICARALKAEADAEDRRNALFVKRVRLRKRLGFIEGMASRLDERISKLAWARKAKPAAGNELVVTKMAKINDFVGDIDAAKARKSIIDDESFELGRKRADAVQLTQGIRSSGNEALAIDDLR
jgi:Protein of unknown function (DUF2786).